jgi:hypothetical protein
MAGSDSTCALTDTVVFSALVGGYVVFSLIMMALTYCCTKKKDADEWKKDRFMYTEYMVSSRKHDACVCAGRSCTTNPLPPNPNPPRAAGQS